MYLSYATELARGLGGHVSASQLDVWLYSLSIDVSARGRLVAGHRDRNSRAIAECHNGLDETLAEGLLPGDGGPLVVL